MDILILGAGGFGRRAAATLARRHPEATLTLVDPRPQRPEAILREERCRLVRADGIAYLDARLSRPPLPDWIVPALPRHLAYEWLRLRLAGRGRLAPLALPEALRAQLPNPMRGPGGELYCSNADFICPADCPEPATICTHTGRPRPRTLHRHLAALRLPPLRSLVLRSLPLGPGVGGYRPADLFALLENAGAQPGALLIATACACHGVLHGLSYEPAATAEG
jgi:hypothetical protein